MQAYTFRPSGTASLYRCGPSRPLSDIREITEPSLLESSLHKANENAINEPLRLQRDVTPIARVEDAVEEPTTLPTHHRPMTPNRADVPHRIAESSIPPRSSSRSRKDFITAQPCKQRINNAPPPAPASPRHSPMHMYNHRQAISPVKEFAATLQGCGKSSGGRVPSKTLVRLHSRTLENILDHPTLLHPRIRVDLQPSAPLFVGGSTVEGTLRILVDEADRVRHRKTLAIERVSVDLLGVEERAAHKRCIFLALSNEIINGAYPPPAGMVESTSSISLHGRSWTLVPSVAILPFLITLPLEIGPPTFNSKYARIRYILSATMVIKDCGRQLSVRSAQPTFILSVYDPERALVSLPTPLTATDKYVSRSQTEESVRVTAGLHRQVWVSGTTIFVDVHIVNRSRKIIGRIELQLERILLCYRYASEGVSKEVANDTCIVDQTERNIICKSTLKQGQQAWTGVNPYETCLRTCDLDLPRGHTTIKRTKYFEVQYYLNVTVSTMHHKIVTVQLPVFLIHMNSLDIPSNSVAQVAAAIHEKRGFDVREKAVEQYGSLEGLGECSRGRLEGRAFSAPRKQSLEQERAQLRDISELTRELEASPRKTPRRNGQNEDDEGSPRVSGSPRRNRRGRIFLGNEADALRQQFNKIREKAGGGRDAEAFS